MVSDISLTFSARRNLITLQDIEKLAGRTQERLTSGRSVNNVLDDAVAFFRSKTLSDTANDYEQLRKGIDQGVSALDTFLTAIDAIENLLGQSKALIEAQRSNSTNQRVAATKQFKELGQQVSNLIEDAQFQGITLLKRTTTDFQVRFGRRTSSDISIGGYSLNSTAAVTVGNVHARIFSVLPFTGANSTFIVSVFFTTQNFLGFSAVGSANSVITVLDEGLSKFQSGIERLRGQAAEIGVYASVLKVRLSFTRNYVSGLSTASDKLVLADLNEEGANLVALQTRQQLGLQALRINGQNQQAVIQLLN